MSEENNDTPQDANEDSEHELCPICLGAFEDRALINDCLHSFCFDCIVEWSKNRLNCPLCKQRLLYVLHGISADGRSYFRHNFSRAHSPSRRSGAFDVEWQTQRFRPYERWSRRYHARPRRIEPEETPLPEDERIRNAFNRRRFVYSYGVRAKHVGANTQSQYRPPLTPESLRQSPARLQRLRPWIRRDLQALLDETNVELLLQFIEGALVTYALQSEQMIRELRPFLGRHTEHFIHELVSFARSPFEINTYDQNVQYDWPAEAHRDLSRYPLIAGGWPSSRTNAERSGRQSEPDDASNSSDKGERESDIVAEDPAELSDSDTQQQDW